MLKKTLEKLAALERGRSDELLSCIAYGLGSAGSRMAQAFALPIIRKREKKAFHLPGPYPRKNEEVSALIRAIVGFARSSNSDDLEIALGWIDSPNALIKLGGYHTLARLDDQEAVDAVLGFISDPSDHRSSPIGLRYYYVLGQRSWPNEKVKRHYIHGLNKRMQKLVDGIGAAKRYHPDLLELDGLIHTLERMTRAVNGRDSFASPGFNARRAIETARNWDRWVAANVHRPG